jgi:hypothetical protein
VKIIEACFKLDNNKYYHTNCNTRCKTSNIYYCIIFISYKVPESDLKIIFDHGCTFIQFVMI